jgi:hypothetical protein
MTPKEKAEQLVSTYLLATPIGFHIEDAKKCALIAVDFIIEQNNVWIIQTKKGTNNFWNEVKHEIQKL